MSQVSLATPEKIRPFEPDFLYEIVDGEIREIPNMGVYAGIIATVLANSINQFARPRNLGLAVVEVLFKLGPNLPSRRPDVAYVTSDKMLSRVQALEDPPQWEVVPNLAIEVVSKTNTAAEIEDKLGDYFGAGVQLVWVIYPVHRRVYVYESINKNRILTEQNELDGGDMLPGFTIPLSDLFNAYIPPQ